MLFLSEMLQYFALKQLLLDGVNSVKNQSKYYLFISVSWKVVNNCTHYVCRIKLSTMCAYELE